MKKAILALLLTAAVASLMSGCSSSRILTDDRESAELIARCEKKFESPDWVQRLDAVAEISTCVTPPQNLSVFKVREEFRINRKVEELIIRATYDPHPQVRIEALRVTGSLLTRNILKRIKVMATREKNENVRWHAIKSLSLFRDPASLDIFIEGFKSRDWLIREASIAGILSLKSSTIKTDIVPVIINAINDPSSSVRITAMRMATIKDRRIYRAARSKLTEKIYSEVTLLEAVLTVLHGYRLDSETRDTIINLLGHDNSRIRVLALRVLKKEKILLMGDK